MNRDLFDVDPELAELFATQPDLLDLGRRLRDSRPEAPLDERFRAQLRARLMDAAPAELHPHGWRRMRRALGRPSGVWVAGSGAVLGVAMAGAAAAIVLYSHSRSDVVTVGLTASNVAEKHTVDTTNVIEISFNQPMDRAAVVKGISIEPATSFTTQWKDDNTLIIVPAHHLAANTPYTVRIPQQAARDKQGHTAAAPIVIAFGTKPAPSATPVLAPAPPELELRTIGSAAAGGLVIAPDDGVTLASGLLPAASPAATPAAGATPVPTPSASASPTASAPAVAAPGLVHIAVDGSTSQIGPAVRAVAYSPAGRNIAFLVAHDDGSAELWVANVDGSSRKRLAVGDTADSPLAWSAPPDAPAVLFVSGGRLRSVDLAGRLRTVTALTVAPGQTVLLAPGGRFAYFGPPPGAAAAVVPGSPGPTPSATLATTTRGLVDLVSGAVTTLLGADTSVAFSADGATAAWVDRSASAPTVEVAPTAGGRPAATVPLGASGLGIGGALALDRNGSRLAIEVEAPDAQLRMLAVSDGTLLGVTRTLASEVRFNGDRLVFLVGNGPAFDVVQATVPGPSVGGSTPGAIPAEASALLDRLVSAQVSPGNADLGTLPVVASGPDLAGLTPAGLTRGYVVSADLSGDGGAVVAHVRLIRDPTADSPDPQFADETVTLDTSAGAGYAIAALQLSKLSTEPTGPKVIHVDSRRDKGDLVVSVTFDSDLDPATVASAVQLSAANGQLLETTVDYDIATRTATVTTRHLPERLGPAQLTIGSTLRDINGNPLSRLFSTATGS